MGFKRRMGINIREEMQIDSLDIDTRTKLYNVMVLYMGISYDDIPSQLSLLIAMCLNLKIEPNAKIRLHRFTSIFEKCEWSDIYEICEKIYLCIGYEAKKEDYIGTVNIILEQERCNYRMNDVGEFIKVANEEEFKSLEQSQDLAQGSVKEHFNKALAEYSKRGNNNYDTVCNESIKALEAIARQYLDKKYSDKTLGQCINPLRTKLDIPSFIIEPIQKIWETSNHGEFNTRHAKQEDITLRITEAEAYFILITCSSFINYLSKTAK